jgi:NADPH:quinone reductase-like Zn-dependent oxidoreductase
MPLRLREVMEACLREIMDGLLKFLRGHGMKAVRIHRFGGPEVVVIEDVPVPTPGEQEVLVRVAAAGVAPWDALIREGLSKVSPQLPLTLGSDLSGVVQAFGNGVSEFAAGDVIYGVTNPQFCGAQAEYAVTEVGMIALKPPLLDFAEAASVPVIAVTAWQMLFEYAQAKRGQAVMILGAAGNVGAYAVQMAIDAGVRVVAVAYAKDEPLLRSLGAQSIVDSTTPQLEKHLPVVDVILDCVGGKILELFLPALKPGGKLVTVVSTQPLPQRADVQPIFFYAEVTAARLRTLTTMFEERRIAPRVGSILPLDDARTAHQMLAGAPHKPGKIVLQLQQ